MILMSAKEARVLQNRINTQRQAMQLDEVAMRIAEKAMNGDDGMFYPNLETPVKTCLEDNGYTITQEHPNTINIRWGNET